jgi:hypothetical protein
VHPRVVREGSEEVMNLTMQGEECPGEGHTEEPAGIGWSVGTLAMHLPPLWTPKKLSSHTGANPPPPPIQPT